MSPCFSIVPLKGLYQHLYQRCFPVLVFVLQILCWLCIHSDDILSSIYSRSLSFILRHKSILPLKVKHLGNVNPRHSLSLFSFTLPLHHAFRKGKTWMCVVCMYMGFPGVSVKNLPANASRHRFDLWVGTVPWRKKWLPTPVFLPGEFHRQRKLLGYSQWGYREPDTTEQLTLTN